MKNIKGLLNNKNVQWILSTIIFLTSLFIFTFVLCNIYKSRNKELNPKTDGETTSININGTTITNESGNTIATIIDEETGEEITVVIDSNTGEVLTTTTNPETGEVITKVITTKPTVPKTEPTTKLRMNVDKIVNNIDELKGSNLSVGKTIHTNGYYSANDGGEGYYRVEAKSKQVIDNGKYILLNNDLVASLIPIDNTYNVKQFGAKGNNSNDDTTAITNAIKNLNDVNVYIPSGTYIISSRISIPANSPKGVLMGDGESSLLKAAAGTKRGSDILSVSNANNLTIKNIAISGNSEVNTRDQGHDDKDGIHLLDIWGANNLTIDHCYFIDNIYTGIRMIKDISNTKVINSVFRQTDCGIEFMGSGNADHILIENNSFDGHKNSEPISFFGKGCRYTNIIINKNTLKNKAYAGGIFLGGYPDSGTTFENVTVTNNNIDRLATGIVLKNGHTVYINNNTVTETQGGGGIKVINSDDVEVKKNTVIRSKQFGLQIESSKNITAEENTFTNCGYGNNDFFFVDIRGTNENVLFNRNTLNRTDETLVIYLMSVHSKGGVKVTNNTFNNGNVWLGKESEGIILTNNNVKVRNDGTNNIIN